MVRVGVFYPYKEGVAFDMDYYLGKHIPMVMEKLGGACKGMTVEKGVAGASAGTPPIYAVMGHFLFESADAYQKAFGPHAAELMGDVPNYTPIQPLVQISEIKA